VREKCIAFRSQIDYKYDNYLEKISEIPGPNGYEKTFGDNQGSKNNLLVPLNMFLAEEISQMIKAIDNIKKALNHIIDVIDRKILTDEETEKLIDDIYYDNTRFFGRIHRAHNVHSLSSMFINLIEINEQLSNWLEKGRPKTFDLGAFLNPKG